MSDRIAALLAIVRGETTDVPPLPPREERRVPPSGPLDAAIAIIGESAGEEEVERGRPFVGRSGQKLRQWMRHAKVDPASVYMDNVYPYLPPGKSAKNILPERLAEETAKLSERLAALSDLKVVVPVGNLALKTLLGLEGIMKHRGSVYEWEGIPAIPLIHPAAILRGQEKMERRCYLDWIRIQRASRERPIPPQVDCITNPTRDDVEALLTSLRAARHLSIDIETKPSEGRILCVGFATSPDRAYVFEWPRDEAIIRYLCAHDIPKVLWNHAYDLWWLLSHDIPIKGRIIDGMHMMHCLQPTDNVSLAYAASIYTFQPYWKDSAKEEDDKTAEENWEQFKAYNGLDAATPLAILPQLERALKEQGLEAFYVENYEEMSEPIMDVMLKGVRIDQERRKRVEAELLTEAGQKRDELATYNGGEPLFTLSSVRDKHVYSCMQQGLTPLGTYTAAQVSKSLKTIAAKTVSTTKLRGLLYGKCDIPAVFKRRSSGEETETIDIFTLRKLRYDHRDNADVSRIIDLAIEHTRAQKLASFISDDKFDEDGRMRFSLKQTTETLRLASSASPRGRKVNSQNIPRDRRVRSLILPEKGHICMQVDGSAAEARNCFTRTGDSELVRLAGLRSDVYDQHQHTGVIVGLARTNEETPENFATVTGLTRQLCKPISHGCVDATTEVLTQEEGFVQIRYLTEWHTVAQYNKETKAITFCKPALHKYRYTQELLYFTGGFISQRVTPDHRVLYNTNGNDKVVRAQDFPKGGTIPLNGYYSGPVKISDALARLLVACQADGSLVLRGGIRWKLRKERKIDRLLELLAAAGLSYRVETVQEDTGQSTNVHVSKEASSSIRFWLPDKKFSAKLLQLCDANLDAIIDELPYWDGGRDATLRYRSSDAQCITWIQTIAHLRGLKASVSQQAKGAGSFGSSPCWEICISTYQYSTVQRVQKIPYDGFVYCVTVPNAFFVMRRNGHVSITGNSQRSMQGITLAQTILREGLQDAQGNLIVFTVEHCDSLIERYHRRFPAIRRWHQEVRARLRRDKKLTNSWGFTWPVEFADMNDELFRRGYSFLLQCCDRETDILTENGFIPFPEYVKNGHLRVMQWHHDTGSLSLTKPLNIHMSKYRGDMMQFGSDYASQLVTPNHKIGYTTLSHSVFHIDEAINLEQPSGFDVPACGLYEGSNIGGYPSRSVIQLLVATQADATLDYDDKIISWHFSKQRKIDRITQLLDRAGVGYKKSLNADGTTTFWTSGAWWSIVEQWLPRKQFSAKFLHLPAYHRAVFVKEAALWDGHENRTTRGGISFKYVTTDRTCADIYQAAAVSVGFRATLRIDTKRAENHSDTYRVNVFKRNKVPLRFQAFVPYNDFVYCVTVPTGFFVVRREGNVSVTGNSDIAQWLNLRGFKAVHYWLKKHKMQSRVMLQEHDGLVLSCAPDEAYDVACFLRASLEAPWPCAGREIWIPVEWSVCSHWGKGTEFTQLPERGAFEAALSKYTNVQ